MLRACSSETGIETAFGPVALGRWSSSTARTAVGGDRIVDLLVGEQLPRIC
jgi:hypothetical protein